MTVAIYLRDAGRQRTEQVSDYTQLTLALRHNDLSAWMLDVPSISADTDFTSGIIVVRDGVTILSGPVTGIAKRFDGNRQVVTLSGVDDSVSLADGLALPVPSGPPYSAAEYDTTTGPAETVLRYFVDRNLGPSATTARRVSGLTLQPNLGRGKTITGSGRFHPLYELLKSLALAANPIGFRVVQHGTALEFEVYVPTDLTETALFSPALGNLAAYDYKTTAPGSTYAYVAGQGEGTARVVVEGGDSTRQAIYGRRIETFRDRRDTADTAVLAQTVGEELTEKAPASSLSITPLDTDALTFGRDYNLGDLVTVVVDGAALQDVVREVNLTYTPDGERITPVIGTTGASASRAGFFDDLKRLSRRLSLLERR